ncbi:hypothetical protein NDU88_002141 [Pleurodeles waltl]|uniref:Uncharacterized protein n=1 Tax=Pleurodeles waltl TaxID=8319 RepID=A0AAV7UUQ0_PLEWA|nr:hypothetical protein NDU88_002141 [Pleurodeles waltl]
MADLCYWQHNAYLQHGRMTNSAELGSPPYALERYQQTSPRRIAEPVSRHLLKIPSISHFSLHKNAYRSISNRAGQIQAKRPLNLCSATLNGK